MAVVVTKAAAAPRPAYDFTVGIPIVNNTMTDITLT